MGEWVVNEGWANFKLYLNVCDHFLMSLTIFITILTDW